MKSPIALLFLLTFLAPATTRSLHAQNNVSEFEVAPGLELTLAADSPDIVSIGNIDVDHRGRVWACEIVNYGKGRIKRPEGDRIVIMEDTTGDGKMDSFKTFYQGTDIDASMGLCVLSDRVIVSATPNIWVLFDDDNDDKADRKELLFSGDGAPSHDHSYHSLVFGPDGKMYWNFGNTGKNLRDKNGGLLKDLHSREINGIGKPFWGGMVFRSNLDGSDTEVLAHNFRNNYEVTVDSFGNLWQTDNDDDGNKATRLNFIVEGGNYGFLDELTGEGWRKKRTGMHEEVSLRHWHLRDPGVIPNVLQTGAGAPTGITAYEGTLLPPQFQNQPIYCDSGVHVVRACLTKVEGAGYTAQAVPLMEQKKDKMFRPIDVAVAPDGSLFISDWYDSVVGGFQQREIKRGRLFRIAPKGSPYKVPNLRYDTPKDAVAALKNPNYCVRAKAWTSLRKLGDAEEGELRNLFESQNPIERARALWLLGQIEGHARHYLESGAKDPDPNVRIVALRLARQTQNGLIQFIARLAKDPSPMVRRECAVAMVNLTFPEKAELWTTLALQHDGRDRWYLEALGVAAESDWDSCFKKWIETVGGDWNTAPSRDIIWRSRSKDALPFIAKIFTNPNTSKQDQLRFMRALDFHPSSSEKNKTLVTILNHASESK